MKHLFALFLLISLSVRSQTVIYETKLDKFKPVIRVDYLPNKDKLLFQEAESNSGYCIFNKILTYDSNANSEVLFKDGKYIGFALSEANDSFLTFYKESNFGKVVCKVITNNNIYEIKDKDFISLRQELNEFNNKYKFNVTGKNGNIQSINIEKDDIFISKLNFIENKKGFIKLQKPDINRLKSKEILTLNKIAFRQTSNYNNDLEIVTKSVSDDKYKTVLYRTIYDLEGKQLSDNKYEIEIDNGKSLEYSDTFSFQLNTLNANVGADRERSPAMDLDINEFFVDRKTEEVYVYGVLKNEKKDPYGFYIFKFSKEGKLIWKKTIDASDKEGFIRKNYWSRTSIKLFEFMNDNQILITLRGERKGMTDIYNLFYVFDKNSGNQLEYNTFNNTLESSKGTFSYGIGSKYSIFENNKIGKNKFCNPITFAAYTLNKGVKSYIDKIMNKKELQLYSYITSQGIWLSETDNETYFKTTLFK